jgi:hypothetical protein
LLYNSFKKTLIELPKYVIVEPYQMKKMAINKNKKSYDISHEHAKNLMD